MNLYTPKQELWIEQILVCDRSVAGAGESDADFTKRVNELLQTLQLDKDIRGVSVISSSQFSIVIKYTVKTLRELE